MTMKIGDAAWWRGMRMVVTRMDGGKFRLETVDALVEDPDWVSREVVCVNCETRYTAQPVDENREPKACETEDCGSVEFRPRTVGRTMPAYIVAAAIADAKWNEDLQFWFLPGIAGELPRAHIAGDGTVEIVDPEIPRCVCEKAEHDHDAPHEAITFRKFVEKVEEGEEPIPPVPYCTNCILADKAAEVA